MAILALDLGARRVGLAINEVGSIVTELPTLAWTSVNELVAAVGILVGDRNIQTIVAGSPRSGSQLEALLVAFQERLSNVEIVLLDETLSTKEAERQLATEGVRGDSDARAAKILLEQYLTGRSNT